MGVVRRGAAAQRAGRRHAHALRSGARAIRRPAGGLGRALAARRGVGAAHHRRAHGLAHQPGRDGRGPVGHRTPGARAAGRHGGRRQQDPRSPVRPRHPWIRRRPAIVGAGPSPVRGRGARRAHFPRPGRAALTGLLPGGAGRRAQPRAGAARRDAGRDAGARHDHSGRAAGGRGGEPGGRYVLVRVAPTPARRRRRAPRPAAGQPFHLGEPRRVLLTRRGRARRQRTCPPARPGPGTDDAGQSRRSRHRRRGAAGRLRTGRSGRRGGGDAADRPRPVGVAGDARRLGLPGRDQARASRRQGRAAGTPAGTIPLAYHRHRGRPHRRRLPARRPALWRQPPQHAEPGQSGLVRPRRVRVGGDLPGGGREPRGVRPQAAVHLARLPCSAGQRVRGRGLAADRGPRGRERSLPAPRGGGRRHYRRRGHDVADRERRHDGSAADRAGRAHRVGLQPVQDRARCRCAHRAPSDPCYRHRPAGRAADPCQADRHRLAAPARGLASVA